MPFAAYLGARRPGLVGVLAIDGGYGRSSGILGNALDTVVRPIVERREGRCVEVRRGRHGHGRPCSGRVQGKVVIDIHRTVVDVLEYLGLLWDF
ncbi:hypothetical protein QYE76_042717 [Lolium multiflorum]|uniref:Uncharacterized protein n=1 Tax=Lolium multiflorum TaxID=4521 RepID=A0AAD8THI0_LOLMU|nr:hypothetical protein QYE76_042717 [Lolium multiflorum]